MLRDIITMHSMRRCATIFILPLLLTSCTDPIDKKALRIAVASNFTEVAKVLAADFAAQSEVAVQVSSGSTGKLYHQIKNGGPFDILLAADAERPQRLVAEGLAESTSLMTYALGQLYLWLPKANSVADCVPALRAGIGPVSMANPNTAPYGAAARATMEYLQLLPEIQPRLVVGENISQTFLFVYSGNAEAGFIAGSQVSDDLSGCLQQLSTEFYPPIMQQAVVVKPSAEATRFMDYLGSGSARQIIKGFGYNLPAPGAK